MNNISALKRNLISNGVLLLLNAVNSLVLPPFLVKRLGVGAYGIIPLATAVVGYASLITVGINGSVSRFLAIDLAKKNYEGANKTFNTALSSIVVLLLVLLLVMILLSVNIYRIISIPAGLYLDSSILFICVSIAFLFSTLSSLFNSSAYVANRLDLVNRVSVINTYLRLGMVFLLFFLLGVNLVNYGYSILIGGIASLIYSFFLFKKYTPQIKLNLRVFNFGILKELFSMGGWLVIIQLGSILFLQIDLIVINRVLGNKYAGQYSLLLQWSNMIRTFAITLSGALGPLILKLYAEGKEKEMIDITMLSNKALSSFLACIVCTLCIISGPLLHLWIGKEYVEMRWLFILLLMPLPINLGVLPLFSINRAYNQVKIPGLFTCIMGVLNLFLAIFLVKYTYLGLYGVATASAIVLTIKNFIFIPLYTAKSMGIDKWTFFKPSLDSLLLILVSFLFFLFYDKIFTIKSWVVLFIHAGMLFILFSGFTVFLLNKKEKAILLQKVRRKS